MNKQTVTILFLLVLFSSPDAPAQEKAATASTLSVAGLRERVTVRRDDRGIPYIEAKNDDDLYFAQGYVTASDRLWQMDLLRRTERGELAEVLGAGPNNIALEQDKQHRTLGFAQVVDAELKQASPESHALLEAYARGVNAYIASLTPKTLPPEFQVLQYQPKPWTPADSLLIGKVFAEGLSNTWRLDLMRAALAALPAEKRAGLMPEISPLDVLVVGKDTKETRKQTSASLNQATVSPDDLAAVAQDQEIANHALARVGLFVEGLAASNNWVVSGKHTVTGKPLQDHSPRTMPHLDLATDEAKAFLQALRDGDPPIVIADGRTAFQIEFAVAEDGPTFTVTRPGRERIARRFNAGWSYDVKAMAAQLLADLGP